jgi:hypothetical protein
MMILVTPAFACDALQLSAELMMLEISLVALESVLFYADSLAC